MNTLFFQKDQAHDEVGRHSNGGVVSTATAHLSANGTSKDKNSSQTEIVECSHVWRNRKRMSLCKSAGNYECVKRKRLGIREKCLCLERRSKKCRRLDEDWGWCVSIFGVCFGKYSEERKEKVTSELLLSLRFCRSPVEYRWFKVWKEPRKLNMIMCQKLLIPSTCENVAA